MQSTERRGGCQGWKLQNSLTCILDKCEKSTYPMTSPLAPLKNIVLIIAQKLTQLIKSPSSNTAKFIIKPYYKTPPLHHNQHCLKPCQVMTCIRSGVDSTGNLTSRYNAFLYYPFGNVYSSFQRAGSGDKRQEFPFFSDTLSFWRDPLRQLWWSGGVF